MALSKDVLRFHEHLAMLGRLASTLSHEIRNPLGALCLLVDVLEEELQQSAPGSYTQVAPVLAEMRTTLSRMDNLVQDYLSLARLAELHLEPVDLGAVVETCAQEVHKQCADSSIALSLEDLASLGQVNLQQNSFRRVLINLMQNAFDAMPQGGTLTLRGWSAGSWTYLEVRDTGCGIAAEHLHKLFAPFHTTKANGTGLGLYVVREILGAHGGTINVASTPGTGTTCLVTLPLVTSP
jgi:two-component system, NtrC family, sensor histidine kinase HydH